jgi:hypothetical protein
MVMAPMLRQILDNEALTRGLGDPEARLLVEWLVGEAEILADMELEEDQLAWEIHCLCERGRLLSRFVLLWCYRSNWGAACQLAATERFSWPLPSTAMDPCELMEQILGYEANLAGA